VPLDGSVDITRHGVTSEGKGDVSWQAIFDELCDGEDVELDLAYLDADGNITGRHYVEVVGAGTILGIPYIQHVSDHLQSDVDPLDNLGTGQVDFEWLIGDLALNSFARIDQIIVQSYVPEPGSLLGLLMLPVVARVRPRR
jgi:hypothetical protein